MKRIGNLFKKAFSIKNLYQAYLDARKGKRMKKGCFEFEINLGSNLSELYQLLNDDEYCPMPYKKFIVYEPKERVLYAPQFRDTVVQHAIYRIIYPIFDKTFISSSFACRKGYGTHKASDYTQKALRACDSDDYTLKLDIRKFFYSIDRNILRKMIERKIKDRRFVNAMMMFTDMDTKVGIPIGNLLSQIYALIYLNPLDHYIKRDLKIKRYVRYVDDFILFGLSRDKCLLLRQKIISFLNRHLHLSLSKSTIQKVKKGVNFVGYRTWQGRRFIRKYSLYKFKRMVKRDRIPSIISLLGHAKRTCSLPYMFKIIKEEGNDLQLPKSYRRIYNTCVHGP